MRHRQALKDVIAGVIRKPMAQKEAATFIKNWAADRLGQEDRARFVEIAETELMAIHEGNFARYQVTPAEFKAWRAVWQEEVIGFEYPAAFATRADWHLQMVTGRIRRQGPAAGLS